MEIAGDLYKPFLGLVNQTTLGPLGRLIPWKMTRITKDPESDGVPTPNNAIPTFKSAISAKRQTTGKMEQASLDPAFNFFVVNPFAAMTPVREGMYLRMACIPNHVLTDPLIVGGVVGIPITGAPTELITALPGLSYIFLAIRIKKIHHMADCAAGQPFDFDFETVHAYAMPGESLAQITAYGFSATVGVGGFF